MPLVSKNFSDIITFSRLSGATWFNSAGVLQGIDFSSTSETVGTGSKSFTLNATAGVNRYWTPGDSVRIGDASNPSTNYMDGVVSSYTASTQVLVVNVTSVGGSGTFTAWRVSNLSPRFDYDPATLAARGFLIEEQRTNLLTYSQELDNVAWTATDITLTADNTAAPDGTTTADLLTEGTAGTAFITRLAAATVSAGATVTSSFFVKRSAVVQWLRLRISNSAGANGGNVWLDIQNGVLGNQTNIGSGTNTVGTITPINNGWYRITATTTLAAGDTTALTFAASASANGSTTRVNNSAYWLWGAQLEAGAFPTSYIPTTTIQATRAPDVASVNTLSPWFNDTASTIYTEAVTPPNLAGFPTIASLNDGSANNQISHYLFTNGYYANVRSGGVGQGDPSRQIAPVSGNVYKFAVAIELNNAVGCANGSVGVPDTSLLMPVGINQMRIGANATGGAVSNTWIRRITYYPRRLSNAELQAITT